MYAIILETHAPQQVWQGSLIQYCTSSDLYLSISLIGVTHFWAWLLQTRQWIFDTCWSEKFFVCYLCPTNGVTFII